MKHVVAVLALLIAVPAFADTTPPAKTTPAPKDPPPKTEAPPKTTPKPDAPKVQAPAQKQKNKTESPTK